VKVLGGDLKDRLSSPNPQSENRRLILEKSMDRIYRIDRRKED
jgi:hypothetical protein